MNGVLGWKTIQLTSSVDHCCRCGHKSYTADGLGTRHNTSFHPWACLGLLVSAEVGSYYKKVKQVDSCYLALWLWLRVPAGEAGVVPVENVEKFPDACDHVRVALADGTLTSSNWVRTDNLAVHESKVVVDQVWVALGTVVKSKTAVTLYDDIFTVVESFLDGTVSALEWQK